MTTCAHCGTSKAQHTIRCEHCDGLDERVAVLTAHGVPLLTLTVLGLIGVSVYRFWTLGWQAWHGNLRFAALAAIFIAGSALLMGSAWSFGIRRRREAVLWLLAAVPTFLWVNSL